ncbi:MAG: hypothetical protein NTW32_07675 [Chloroflexi bacterium]|nr:hypothetical protein [Chloroflexota bacterium]
MDLAIGDVGPANLPERHKAFIREAPKMVEWLKSLVFASIMTGDITIIIRNFPAGPPLVADWNQNLLTY